MGVTVRCNCSTGLRYLFAGSVLGQIVGCNIPTDSDHNISQRCYHQHHHSLSLYVTDQALHRCTNTFRITGLDSVTCAQIVCQQTGRQAILIAQSTSRCVYKTFKAMCHKSTKHHHIYGRQSSGHCYKNFPNKVKMQSSCNSHCGIPHALQVSLQYQSIQNYIKLPQVCSVVVGGCEEQVFKFIQVILKVLNI